MHFLIFLALIGCFVMFPGFRKAIASLLVLIAIGFTIIYGPMMLIAGVPKGQGNFWFWTFFVVIGFIVFYAFVYSDKKAKKLNTNPPNIVNELAVQTEIEASSWNQAINEFEGETRNRGLYAKLFAETQGDESKVKARYIEIRAKEIQSSKIQVVPPAVRPRVESDYSSIANEKYENESQKNTTIQPWKQIFQWGGVLIVLLMIGFWFINQSKNNSELSSTKKNYAELKKTHSQIVNVSGAANVCSFDTSKCEDYLGDGTYVRDGSAFDACINPRINANSDLKLEISNTLKKVNPIEIYIHAYANDKGKFDDVSITSSNADSMNVDDITKAFVITNFKCRAAGTAYLMFVYK